MPSDTVIAAIADFIRNELVYGDEAAFGNDTDLIETGIIDSMGLLRLVSFLEEHYAMQIPDEAIVPDNFRSVSAIESFIAHVPR